MKGFFCWIAAVAMGKAAARDIVTFDGAKVVHFV